MSYVEQRGFTTPYFFSIENGFNILRAVSFIGIAAAVALIDAALQVHSEKFFSSWFERECDLFHDQRSMIPAGRLGDHLLVCGDLGPRDGVAPTFPNHVAVRGKLIPIRRVFDQHVNLHLIRMFVGVSLRVVISKSSTIYLLIIG